MTQAKTPGSYAAGLGWEEPWLSAGSCFVLGHSAGSGIQTAQEQVQGVSEGGRRVTLWGGRGSRQNTPAAGLRPSASLQLVLPAASCGVLQPSSEEGKGARKGTDCTTSERLWPEEAAEEDSLQSGSLPASNSLPGWMAGTVLQQTFLLGGHLGSHA